MAVRHCTAWSRYVLYPFRTLPRAEKYIPWGLGDFPRDAKSPPSGKLLYCRDVFLGINWQQEWYWIRTLPRGGMYWKMHPEAREISQGQGFCTPRPKWLPEGPSECMGKYCLQGQYCIRTLLGAGSVLDNMISVDHVIQYHPCCQWIPRNTSLQCD